jgi:hypothetical protein
MQLHRKITAPLALAAVAALAGLPLQAQQSYQISGDHIAIYNLAGEVTLEPGSGSQVVVEVTLHGDDAGQLQVETGEIRGRETLRVIYPGDRVVYDRRGGGSTELRVRADGTFSDGDWDDYGRRGDRVRISGSGDGLEAWADLRILVPSGQTLAVYLASGEVSATNVRGDLRLDTHSAPVTTSGTRGDLLVDVGSGRVNVSDAEGNVDIDTGSGSVEVTDVRGDMLRVDTGSGRVTGSRISVTSLDIDTGSGSVEIAAAMARDVRVDTGSGGVDLELTADPGDVLIDTGSGSVTLTVPGDFGAELEIETGSGSIDLDFPVTVNRVERNAVRGTVGDGGGHVVIDTGSGGVRIRRAG